SRHEAHRHLARDLTGGVPAHAVRNHEDSPVRHHEEAVLVPRPDDADVGAASGGDVHGRCYRSNRWTRTARPTDPRASTAALAPNTSCTAPSRTVAPGAHGASPFTRSPSTKVPFVESRSTSTHTPSRRCSFAWLVETDGSGTTTSL